MKTTPRRFKKTIASLTGLQFCDRSCGCGESNRLWWFPTTPAARRRVPKWVPGWMNGSSSEEIWSWLVEMGYDLSQATRSSKR